MAFGLSTARTPSLTARLTWVLIMFRNDDQHSRPLHPAVLATLGSLLDREFPGRSELESQLRHVSGVPIDGNGSLRLVVRGGLPAPVERRVPTEGVYLDDDGVRVHVLLHVVDGYLDELEVYREDSGRVSTSLKSKPPLNTDAPW